MDYESPECLYDLLPAVYRIRDAQQGYPLKAFLRLIAGQVKILKEDIDRLWDNFFIETCEDWVIPYIADLVGNNPLYDIEGLNRADVAKTIYYRRRKGTVPMLEELARNVTGWGCHAVEFFGLLDWTQNMNHIRSHTKGCPDVRNLNKMDLVDSPFDSVNHTADVRSMGHTEGWYNIRNIGFFLWRLQSYRLENVQACPAKGVNKKGCYHFSPLGNPAPLFHYPERETDESGLAGEIHVPGPIRPAAFHFDMKSYYGVDRSVSISGIKVENIICKNLEDWNRPPAGKVAVDVERGRIAFAKNEAPSAVNVSYCYGFSADIGGGQYERRNTMIDLQNAKWKKTVRQKPKEADEVTTINDALAAWMTAGKPNGIIYIADSGTYDESIRIDLADGKWLAIEAMNKQRPTLRIAGSSYIEVTGKHPKAGLTLSGLMIEGGLDLQGSLGKLRVIHSTLVPGLALDENGDPLHSGLPSIKAGTLNKGLDIEIHRSILGALRLTDDITRLTVKDSIIDAFNKVAIARVDSEDKAGPPTVIERTTVLGKALLKELILASEVIFTQELIAERTQKGCVRFSYVPVPDVSRTPHRFRCQPDLAIAEHAKEQGHALSSNEIALVAARLQPRFTSMHYGHPAYGQLSYHCPKEIKTGAEDGAEMGVFHCLKQAQREKNLHIRLEEYLPFGLKSGFIYVT